MYSNLRRDEEGKCDDDDNCNVGSDEDGERAHDRSRGLQNICRAQQFDTMLSKLITACYESTLSMAPKTPKWLHLVNAILKLYGNFTAIDMHDDAHELSRNSFVKPSGFVLRLKQNGKGLFAHCKAQTVGGGHSQESELSRAPCMHL